MSGLERWRWVVADVDGLVLQVLPVADSDAEELADLAGGLRAELLDVDAASAAPLTAEEAPEEAKDSGRWLAGCWSSSGPRPGCAPCWPPCAGGPRGRAEPWRSASAGMR